MSYESYADSAYYSGTHGGSAIPPEDLGKRLRQASRHIDSLTFNRIVCKGFSNLSEFQQEIIREVVCRQAEFEDENSDILDNILSSYSINGVSANFGDGWNVKVEKGIAIQRDTYELLNQTGLTCRLLR